MRISALEFFGDRRAAAAIDGQKDRVPAAGPAKGRRGALHVRMTFGDFGIVRRGHRPLLHAIGHRRALAHVFQRLRILPALGRQRIAHDPDLRNVQRDMGKRIGADVAGGAVADAIRAR